MIRRRSKSINRNDFLQSSAASIGVATGSSPGGSTTAVADSLFQCRESVGGIQWKIVEYESLPDMDALHANCERVNGMGFTGMSAG